MHEKRTFTGIVKKETFAKGSKSEHQAVVLDTGHGPALKLRILGNNAFHDPELERFVGQRVTFEGISAPGTTLVFIEKAADIVLINGPSRPPRPPQAQGPKL